MLLRIIGALNYFIFRLIPKSILLRVYKKRVNKNKLSDLNYKLEGKKIAILAPHPDDEYLAIESLETDKLEGAITYFQLTDGLSNFDFNKLGRLLRINETYEYLHSKGTLDHNIIRLKYDEHFRESEFDLIRTKFSNDVNIN
ncbi:hypothetical protein, partial [Photobacterium sanguinicancri]